MFKTKYIAVFLIKEHETYNINKAIRFNPLDPIINGLTIDIDNPSFTKKLKSFFFIDNNNNQLSFKKGKPSNIDTKIIDDILQKKIISELTKDMVATNFGKRIFDILTGALIGGLSTFIVAGFVFGGFII